MAFSINLMLSEDVGIALPKIFVAEFSSIFGRSSFNENFVRNVLKGTREDILLLAD